MRKALKRVMPILLSMLILMMLTGFDGKSAKVIAAKSTKATFGIGQFQSEMNKKGYKFKINNNRNSFIPTAQRQMIIGKERITVYLFGSNKAMGDAAKNISSDGSRVYSALIDWIALPHFYKKGLIIVQYVGKNKNIITDLKWIMGKQFAGGKY